MRAFRTRTATGGLTLVAVLVIGLSFGERASAPGSGPHDTREHVTRTTTVDFTWPAPTPAPGTPVAPVTAGV
ncbi:hypothetical protein ACFVWY_33270 [Streptomyces sp. NPDC058195]|uniref:hypothetical protein n=1 Tax=Streptomyces sp. NPDC058195 TaxID=3346375 RepID=UPI0036EC2A1D